MNKAGLLSSDRVMLSLVLKRYYEPLRLPIQPGMISFPYTHRLTLLLCHCTGSPALGIDIIRNMPTLLPRKIELEDSVVCSNPLRPSPSVHRVGIFTWFNEATYRFTCVTACCFANWELTTPDYSDAAPLNYRCVRTTHRTGL